MNQRGKIRAYLQERGDNGHTATKSKNQALLNLSLARPYPIFSLSSTKVLVTQNYEDSFIIHPSPQIHHIHPSRADRASPQHLMPTPSTLHLMRPQLAESPSQVTLPDAFFCHSFLTQNRLFPWARHFVLFFTICRTRY